MLRHARMAAGLTLAQAGSKVGYSVSTLSRIERGEQRLTSVTLLRQFAQAFDVPPVLFGLADAPTPRVSVTERTRHVTIMPKHPADEGGDEPVQRRELLAGIAGLAAGPMLSADLYARTHSGDRSIESAPATQSSGLLDGLEDALLRPSGDVMPMTTTSLRHRLRIIKADFQASRYDALSARLPTLLSRTVPAIDRGALAELYNTAAHILIKLEVHSLGWLAASRALAMARDASNDAIFASVSRNVATLCRRAGRFNSAQRIALDAAEHLDIGSSSTAEHLSLYGTLLCNAGYSAAKGGDRRGSTELFDVADRVAARLGGDRNVHWTAFGPTNCASYRISASYALGDAGIAIEHAKGIPNGAITIPERRARYWIDIALAYQQWNKPALSYRALAVAERAAPEEVRAQPRVRNLAGGLLSAPSHPSMSGLRDLATRVGVEM